MEEMLARAGLALWFGILTAVSPCPLATNIAAVSYIGRRVADPKRSLLAGLLYAAGRAVVYTAIGVLLLYSVTSAPAISFWLQKYMMKILGPVLIITGMFLLGLFGRGGSGPSPDAATAERLGGMGVWGAGLLGMLFALSFCPTSAALFFGSLLSLSTGAGSTFYLPAIFGIGTALPVIAFAVMISAGAGYIGKVFDMVTRLEVWIRRATGVLFVLTGIWFSLRYVFHLF